MNNERRKKIAKIIEKLRDVSSELENVRDDEQDSYDNLTEGLQATDRGQYMETCCELLSEALDVIDDAVSTLESIY